MAEDWLKRWQDGRTGWHEVSGNSGLMAHWNSRAERVLVPLCGKAPDLRWLGERGHRVTGVELSEIAARAFFEEQGLPYTVEPSGGMKRFACARPAIEIYCGDYFDFDRSEFDALYDRGALVAIGADTRATYVEHTKGRLRDDADRLVITLEYDQSVVAGPPFSVMPGEVMVYWPDLERVDEKDDIDNCPPKFRAAGLTDVREVVWRSNR